MRNSKNKKELGTPNHKELKIEKGYIRIKKKLLAICYFKLE
jgi:hypothetical protein